MEEKKKITLIDRFRAFRRSVSSSLASSLQNKGNTYKDVCFSLFLSCFVALSFAIISIILVILWLSAVI